MRGVNDDEVPAFVELTRHAPLNVSTFHVWQLLGAQPVNCAVMP